MKSENTIESLNKWIKDNNSLIDDFKEKNKSEADIDDNIYSKTKMKNKFSLTQKMLNEKIINKYKKAETARSHKESLEIASNKAKANYQNYLEKLPK